jgi:hypothetical protein
MRFRGGTNIPTTFYECATVTVTVEAVVRLPRSETFTQYVPGFSVAVSCAVEPATAADVAFVTEHVPLLDGPTPSPSGLVVDGETEISVTPTLPAVVTVNVKTIEPFCASEPLNVSTVGVAVVESDELVKGFVHAAALITTASKNV